MDTTLTRIGSQCLYWQLRTYAVDDAAAARRYATAQALRRDAALRERIQLRLRALDIDSAAHIADALHDEITAGLRGRPRATRADPALFRRELHSRRALRRERQEPVFR